MDFDADDSSDKITHSNVCGIHVLNACNPQVKMRLDSSAESVSQITCNNSKVDNKGLKTIYGQQCNNDNTIDFQSQEKINTNILDLCLQTPIKSSMCLTKNADHSIINTLISHTSTNVPMAAILKSNDMEDSSNTTCSKKSECQGTLSDPLPLLTQLSCTTQQPMVLSNGKLDPSYIETPRFKSAKNRQQKMNSRWDLNMHLGSSCDEISNDDAIREGHDRSTDNEDDGNLELRNSHCLSASSALPPTSTTPVVTSKDHYNSLKRHQSGIAKTDNFPVFISNPQSQQQAPKHVYQKYYDPMNRDTLVCVSNGLEPFTSFLHYSHSLTEPPQHENPAIKNEHLLRTGSSICGSTTASTSEQSTYSTISKALCTDLKRSKSTRGPSSLWNLSLAANSISLRPSKLGSLSARSTIQTFPDRYYDGNKGVASYNIAQNTENNQKKTVSRYGRKSANSKANNDFGTEASSTAHSNHPSRLDDAYPFRQIKPSCTQTNENETIHTDDESDASPIDLVMAQIPTRTIESVNQSLGRILKIAQRTLPATEAGIACTQTRVEVIDTTLSGSPTIFAVRHTETSLWGRQIKVHKNIILACRLAGVNIPPEIDIPISSKKLFEQTTDNVQHMHAYLERIVSHIKMNQIAAGVQFYWWRAVGNGTAVLQNLLTGKMILLRNTDRTIPAAVECVCKMINSDKLRGPSSFWIKDPKYPVMDTVASDLQESASKCIEPDELEEFIKHRWGKEDNVSPWATNLIFKQSSAKYLRYSIGVDAEGNKLLLQVHLNEPLSRATNAYLVCMEPIPITSRTLADVRLAYLQACWFLRKLFEFHSDLDSNMNSYSTTTDRKSNLSNKDLFFPIQDSLCSTESPHASNKAQPYNSRLNKCLKTSGVSATSVKSDVLTMGCKGAQNSNRILSTDFSRNDSGVLVQNKTFPPSEDEFRTHRSTRMIVTPGPSSMRLQNRVTGNRTVDALSSTLRSRPCFLQGNLSLNINVTSKCFPSSLNTARSAPHRPDSPNRLIATNNYIMSSSECLNESNKPVELRNCDHVLASSHRTRAQQQNTTRSSTRQQLQLNTQNNNSTSTPSPEQFGSINVLFKNTDSKTIHSSGSLRHMENVVERDETEGEF